MKTWIALTSALLCMPLLLFAAQPTEWVSKTVSYATCVGSAGSTNVSTSGAGTDVAHTLACTIAANQLKANGVVNACALFTVATPGTVPTLQVKFKAGSTTLATHSAFPPPVNTTVNGWLCTRTVVRAAPGASVQTDTSFVTYPSATTFVEDSNAVAQPIALATNGALVWTFTSQWLTNAGTGSSLTLNAFVVTVTQ